MTSKQIRQKYLDFMQKKGHAIVPSTSLVPENDPSVLFVTAGVQPLVPYVLGEPHPKGDKIMNIQKCVRTQDIDDVGDATHDTFFEMMGYWSFGDYFKEQSINQLYDFFIGELGLDSEKIYVTCFEGDEDAPKDTESAEIWKSLGIPEERIYFMGKDSNWWKVGDNGPCGPDTEVFYDLSGENLNLKSKEEFLKADKEQKIVEIANSVFMQFEMKDGKVVGELPKKNVDMGSGFERVVMVVQGKDNIFETDLFSGLMDRIDFALEGREIKSKFELKSKRIVADHIRTATFIIDSGVTPSANERGYVLRRLLRNAFTSVKVLGFNAPKSQIIMIIDSIIETYKDVYPSLLENKDNIIEVLKTEIDRLEKLDSESDKKLEKIFDKAMLDSNKSPLKAEVRKIGSDKPFEASNPLINAEEAFKLYSTHGIPKEKIIEYIKKKNYIMFDIDEFENQIKKHQEISRTASAGKFKGGLAGDSEIEKRYHTVTHLLNAALRRVLGDHVFQKGSNINTERMRFDFSHGEKMTDEEKNEAEKLVNKWISAGLDVVRDEMSYEEAKSAGAIGVFEDKYGDTVSVYSIKDGDEVISMELCGGPHVKNTSEIGEFKIKKEEASSAGVRRIKAVLE